MKLIRSFKTVGALALVLTIASGLARAEYPPGSRLAAQWWQWAYEIPLAQNPLLDTNGEFAAIGQSGPVWFVAGNLGGTSERTFTVPAGKPIFFPIANEAFFADTPGYWGRIVGDNNPPAPLAVARAACTAALAQITQMSCEIDGVSVPITPQLREQSVPFAIQLPADNFFGLTGPHLTLPGCVDEGYYVLVLLSPGQHTLHITAANPTAGWSLDVTDHINVQ